jgi:hypothetical protein
VTVSRRNIYGISTREDAHNGAHRRPEAGPDAGIATRPEPLRALAAGTDGVFVDGHQATFIRDVIEVSRTVPMVVRGGWGNSDRSIGGKSA